MGTLCDILEAKAIKRSTSSNPAQWFVDWVGGGSASSSGVTVSNDSALKYTPFWSAVRVISGTLAALPFLTYQRQADGGKKRMPGHRTDMLMHNRPNEFMDAITFIETRQAHALCYGNGYAEIQRDGVGRPVALWPLLPNRTERKIDDQGVPFYEVTSQTGEKTHLPDYNVLHIKGLGFDGYTGYNVVAYQREALGYGVAVKEYGARFFAGDGNLSGTLEHPGILGATAAQRLKEDWQTAHNGLKKAHRLQVLEEGMKWNATGVDPEHAQALEVQKYTVDDCARIFNIPPHKLASMEHATFSNIEEQNIDFYSSTMLYWFKKWEQEVNYKLFLPSEQKTHFAEILVDALLRGSAETRSKLYASGRMWGYMSINDIHRLENMNPIGPEGDVYLDPANMRPAGTLPAEPEPVPPVEDDVRTVLRGMIVDQFKRIVAKNGKYKPEWPRKILIQPVRAYALASGSPEDNTCDLIDAVMRDVGHGDAEQFADRVIQLLGGPNGQDN